tara:strand:+ start:884 stop:1258 length:375 start_codon:yes stop_codon:yes gene_type:complete
MSLNKDKKAPKKKKIINKKVKVNKKLEHYDPTLNDSEPMFGHIGNRGYNVYGFAGIYNLVFNQTDILLETLKDKLYWLDMINSIKDKENTGIIKGQITNITEIEKEKSVMKLFFKMFNELNESE